MKHKKTVTFLETTYSMQDALSETTFYYIIAWSLRGKHAWWRGDIIAAKLSEAQDRMYREWTCLEKIWE